MTVGAKGGVLIYQVADTSEAGFLRTGMGPSTTKIRPYTLGPSVEIGLPFHFRIEVDALYRRFGRTESLFFNPAFGHIDRLSGNDWQFPLLLKFQGSRGRWKPFVSAGASLRYVWGWKVAPKLFSTVPSMPWGLLCPAIRFRTYGAPRSRQCSVAASGVASARSRCCRKFDMRGGPPSTCNPGGINWKF